MSELELLEHFIKLVEYANDEGADGFDVLINVPNGGKLKCKFEYEAILPEGHNER